MNKKNKKYSLKISSIFIFLFAVSICFLFLLNWKLAIISFSFTVFSIGITLFIAFLQEGIDSNQDEFNKMLEETTNKMSTILEKFNNAYDEASEILIKKYNNPINNFEFEISIEKNHKKFDEVLFKLNDKDINKNTNLDNITENNKVKKSEFLKEEKSTL